MKNETKLTVEDFPLQMPCQVTLDEYKEYALWSSREDWKKAKKRCVIQSAILLAAGVIIVWRGLQKTWVYHDILTVFGILMIGYAVFDLVFQFLMFPTLLKRNVGKEFQKDSRLGREMTFCFAEDRMVSFYEGGHQGTLFYEDVIRREENQKMLLLSLKNGKNMVFPKRVINQAKPEIQDILARLGA